jgi:hypothetical protein
MLVPATHAGAQTTVELDDDKAVQHGLHGRLVLVHRQVRVALDLKHFQS